MQTVIVNNKTGIKFNFLGKRILPMREHVGDQPFSFLTCKEALDFELFVNEYKNSNLTALYSPSEEDLKAEGIEMLVDSEHFEAGGDEGDNLTDEEKRAALAKQLESDNSKGDLEKMAEEMKLDFKGLNKTPLAELIAANKEL